jgi:hypothetical protein
MHIKKTTLLILLILILLPCTVLKAQQKHLEKTVSVDFNKNTIQEVISTLNKKTGCNFSLSVGLLPANARFSLSATNKPLSFVLSSILEKYKLTFMEVNNQIIIFQSSQPAIVEPAKPIKPIVIKTLKPEAETHIRDSIVYRTVFDTIVTHDTLRTLVSDTLRITQIDTVKVFDTIRVTVKKEVKLPPKKIAYPIYGWEISLSGQYPFSTLKNNSAAPAFFSELKSNMKVIPSIRAGALLNIQFKSFVIQTGLAYHNQRINWNVSNTTTGSYIVSDTISRYYTAVSGTDTSWVYITRNKTIETQTIQKETSYYTLHNIQIPIIGGYKLPIRKSSVEFKGGVISNILIAAKGKTVAGKDSMVLFTIANGNVPFSRFNFLGFLSLAFCVPLSENSSVVVEPYYYHSLFSLFKTKNWYSQRINYMGVSLSFRKYF